jgi:hypothetical protein
MNVLTASTQQHIEETLINEGIIDQQRLDQLKDEAKQKDESLVSLLLETKILDDEQLTKTLAHASNIPYVNLSAAHIKPEVLDLLDYEVAEQ